MAGSAELRDRESYDSVGTVQKFYKEISGVVLPCAVRCVMPNIHWYAHAAHHEKVKETQEWVSF